MTTATKEDQARIAYEKSANALETANRLKYTNPDRAEVYYDRSAKWLMKYNELAKDKAP